MEIEKDNWKGPIKAEEIIKRNEYNDGGVYIWTLKVNKESYAPYYVGICKNFSKRVSNHMKGFLCGDRTIIDFANCDVDEISNRIKKFKKWEEKYKSKKRKKERIDLDAELENEQNILYYPDLINPYKYKKDFEKNGLHDAIEYMFVKSYFYLYKNEDKDLSKEVESYLLKKEFKGKNGEKYLLNIQESNTNIEMKIDFPKELINPAK